MTKNNGNGKSEKLTALLPTELMNELNALAEGNDYKNLSDVARTGLQIYVSLVKHMVEKEGIEPRDAEQYVSAILRDGERIAELEDKLYVSSVQNSTLIEENKELYLINNHLEEKTELFELLKYQMIENKELKRKTEERA